MPLLETIRRGTDSTTMRLIFGAIVLVFIFWGVGSTTGPKAQIIAEVNGERITDTQFQRIMRQQSRSLGGARDEDELNELARRVVRSLIERKAMLQEAERLGVVVSDEEVARAILGIDAFKDSDGRFEPKLYERALKRMGMKKGQFEQQVREDLTVDKLLRLVSEAVTVSEADVHRAWEQQATRLSVAWVEIPADALLDEVPVSDEETDAFLATDEQRVRQRYEQDLPALYRKPERADISMILLRSDLDQGRVEDEELRRRAEAVLAEARAEGADFAALARRWSEDLSAVNGGRLGALARDQVDPAAADAIFAAEPGGVTDVVHTARGYAVFLVHSREPEVVTPFEDVKRTIARRMIARQRIDEHVAQVAEEVRRAWAGAGEPPEELLQRRALRVRRVESTSLGELPTALAGVGSEPLLQALRAAKEPGVLPESYPSAAGRVVAAVTDYRAPDPDDWEEMAPAVRAQLEFLERQAFVQAWKEDLLARSRVVQYYQP